jgi:hypothetical protein
VSAGGVTAWYSGSPTRFASSVVVTMSHGEDGRAVHVEHLSLPD